MTQRVKKRRYTSVARSEQAGRTRRAILTAARDLFTAKGYDETTVADIAAGAGVAVDTVYASVGRKPQLLLAVVDMVLGSSDEPLPAEDRDYVRAIRAASSAREKIAVYAAALGRLLPRIAPLFRALDAAGRSDDECRDLARRLSERRASNMLSFAEELRETGELRSDLSTAEIADVVWSTNSVTFYALLRERDWSNDAIAELLRDMWTRMFLDGSPDHG